ncbi:uncharacterized protein JCM6883_006891 [Sporobolomyces salmoneus]|uniref:uncharacterized protein n=1 Tax=Sporobolomyces salmoneus TaxID=183962 RepID=UPI00316F0019
MWSAVARLASPAPRKPSTNSIKANEPTFARLYESLRTLLGSPEADRSATLVQTARLQLGQLLAILKVETASKEDGLLGPCIEYALREGTFKSLVDLVEKDEPEGVRLELVEWFSRAVVELDEGFLAHTGVNKPLIKLLRCCVDEEGGLSREEETSVVETMCIVCERIKTRPELLAIFLRHQPSTRRKDLSPSLAASSTSRPPPFSRLSSTGDSDGQPTSPTLSQFSTSDVSMSNASSSTSRRQRSERDFLLLAYLLRFIHREGDVGEFARRGILALCDVALGYPDTYSPSFSTSTLPRSTSEATITPSSTDYSGTDSSTREAVLAFAEYLLDSDFAEVLAAGIGALYGLLPTKLVVRAATIGGGQSGEVVDGFVSKSAGGMQLGGMGALGEEEDAEELERKREEEEDRLRSMGVGLSGTQEVREGLDGFLNLVEFTQEVLKRCAPPRIPDQDTDEEGSAVDGSNESRQRALLLSALTDSILTALRDLFLQSVLYPSILECSETDGSAVAVMSYLEALLEVINEGTKLEGAVLGFLLGEDESSLDRPSLGSSPRPSQSQQQPRRHKPRKSSALLLIEQASTAHRPSSSSYFTSFGRFSLRDLLVSHLHSSSQSTAASALKLLQTILSKHDRWSLALLDVSLDEGATSFPLALRQTVEREGFPVAKGLPKSREEEKDDSSDEDFVYPTAESLATPPLPHKFHTPSKPQATPNKPYRSEFGNILPSTPSVSLHLDHLDTLLSLVGSIDPTYRNSRSMGGGSEMLSSGFANYLQDAETSLAADRGFRRGVLVDSTSDNHPVPSHHRKRSTLFDSKPSLRGQDYAKATTGWRHRMKPNGELVALLLESFSHFFSHSPDVNLALTSVISTVATYPYRSLEGWLLPVIRQKQDSDEFAEYLRNGPSRTTLSDDGDDRSVDFEVEERSRQHSLLSPLPRTPQHFDPSNPPPSVTRAALAQSDSLLSILDALVKSVEQYRAKIPKFDTYLSERRQGLFFVENLADALHLDDLASSQSSFSSIEPTPTIPLPSTPVAKPKPSGLVSFFSPRRPSHNRSPSTPLNKSFSNPQQSATPPSSSNLRRSASNDSISSNLPVPTSNRSSKTAGPASPFVAHYRQTGSITVRPVIVSTPGSKHRSTILPDELEEEEDAEPNADGGAPDSPSRRLSPLPPITKSSDASSSTSDSPSTSFSLPAKKPRETPTVTLSTILDNVILLEEFTKELSAIIFVRREVGIDSVRFV